VYEYKKGVEFELAKDYEEAAYFYKEALKELKNSKEHNTVGYLFMLRRLAFVSMKGKKFAEAERYFTIVNELMPKVSQNNPI